MISLTAQYALRAATFLAATDGSLTSRRLIARATLVPDSYLLKVLGALEQGGLVVSRRGPGGGYRLARAPGKISVLEVVELVEEIPRIARCPLGIRGHERLCPLHALLDAAAQTVEEAFSRTMISDLITTGKKRTTSCSFPGQSVAR